MYNNRQMVTNQTCIGRINTIMTGDSKTNSKATKLSLFKSILKLTALNTQHCRRISFPVVKHETAKAGSSDHILGIRNSGVDSDPLALIGNKNRILGLPAKS